MITRPDVARAAAVSVSASIGLTEYASITRMAMPSFDNASSTHKNVGSEQLATSLKAQAPLDLLSARPEYVAALVRAFHADHPAWSQPLILYFRRAGDGWSLVGLERNP